MKNVLVVEDCAEIQILVKGSLGGLYNIFFANTVIDAKKILSQNTPDLVIIDIVLPDGDGFELCSHIKSDFKTQAIPIFFLTSKTETKDKVLGFSLGADDYIVKPFDPLELRARIESKLKKSGELYRQSELMWKGRLKIEIPFQKVFLVSENEQTELNLTPFEFKLLYYFIAHEGSILSREQLLHAVWGNDVSVVDRTVDTHVCTLRKKLLSEAGYIKSVFGEGYKFSVVPSHNPELPLASV